MINEATQKTIVDMILLKYDAESIWLYGSQARDTAKVDSDIDICIKMKEGSKINRHDEELRYNLSIAINKEVNPVFCTMQNGWMEKLIFKKL